MARTKKVKSSGRFKTRYGKRVRERVSELESKSKKKQICPFCKKPSAKRISAGIWRCKKCNKTFTGKSYYLE